MQKNRSGTILIISLWMLVILTVFALALGQGASLEVNLTRYQRDSLRAKQLVRAGIERALWEKSNDPDAEIDALNETWANDAPAFKDLELGDETFSGIVTVSYVLDGTTLYGLEDEQGKININTAEEKVLTNLFADYDNADEIAASIVAWRTPAKEQDEENYYQSLELPYHCKNEPFQSLAELLLVRHIRENPGIVYGEGGLAGCLTVYGEGKVNINTASEQALLSIVEDADLVEAIAEYRKGDDGEVGTDDDEYFANTSFDEWPQLKIFSDYFCVTSNLYTIHAQAEVKKVKKAVTATVDLAASDQIAYLFWNSN